MAIEQAFGIPWLVFPCVVDNPSPYIESLYFGEHRTTSAKTGDATASCSRLARKRGPLTMRDGQRVVITGLGVVAATGIGVEPFWAKLLSGIS
ncbi:MAG: hypothetical protein N2652_08110, partial [Kiritimatiellae bacterium]|nr:hypothetical protein [Kiritimatiellia bacterium]